MGHFRIGDFFVRLPCERNFFPLCLQTRIDSTQNQSTCVNVSLSTSVKLVSRSVMPAGSCIAWNMESNLMVRCHQTKLLAELMTLSTLSSLNADLASTSPVSQLACVSLVYYTHLSE